MPINATEKRKLQQHAPAQLREATVADPALTDDGWLRVEIDSRRGAVEECPWVSRFNGVPEPEDAAAVLESDGGHFWALWWPQNGQQPSEGGGGEQWFLVSGGPPAVGIGAVGDLALRTDTGDYYEKTTAELWTLRGTLRGPQGLQGNPGPANSLAIGSVGVGTPGATITGAPPAQTLNLVLPPGVEGQQGIQGIQGDKGDKGDKGDQGDTGLSAYEVWLADGNVGTVDDYLASLVGPEGPAAVVDTAVVFRAIRNTSFASAVGWQAISFNAEDIDTAGIFVPPGTKFQPTRAGYYRVTAGVYVAGVAVNSAAYLAISKNAPAGGQNWQYFVGAVAEVTGGTAGQPAVMSTTATVFMNGTTDYVEAALYTVSALTVANTVANLGATTYLEASSIDGGLVGPTGDQGPTGPPTAGIVLGTYEARPDASTYPSGTQYADVARGMTWVGDGVTWALLRAEAIALASPPSSPIGGQRISLPWGSARAVFRYNAGSVSAYKWEAEGDAFELASGGPVTTQVNFAANTSWQITATPTLTIPWTGEWLFRAQATLYIPGGAGHNMVMGVGTASAVVQAVALGNTNDASGNGFPAFGEARLAWTGGTAVRIWAIQSFAGAGAMNYRQIAAAPKRIE